ncbi:hypothetical protein ACFVIM_01045 [Streptomyces sp. NPDC057638]|uniref:hypothetical protein n=1 Tax=Streptomyces sp. NPDC057638 TaxID=3346190 RepID=UPI0036C2D479
MRRIITTLLAVGAALTLTISLPQSARAAQGWISVAGVAYPDPQGCYAGDGRSALTVRNETRIKVYVMDNGDCSGPLVGELLPHEEESFAAEDSVYVPRCDCSPSPRTPPVH